QKSRSPSPLPLGEGWVRACPDAEGQPSPGLRLRRLPGLSQRERQLRIRRPPGSPRGGAAPHSLHWRLMLNLVSARGLPVYSTFFLWSFGTGANQLARPLFAASFVVPLAL